MVEFNVKKGVYNQPLCGYRNNPAWGAFYKHIQLDRPGTTFNQDFFLKTPNTLKDHIQVKGKPGTCLRLIDVAAYRPGHHIEVVMDDDKGQSIAYLKADQPG